MLAPQTVLYGVKQRSGVVRRCHLATGPLARTPEGLPGGSRRAPGVERFLSTLEHLEHCGAFRRIVESFGAFWSILVPGRSKITLH